MGDRKRQKVDKSMNYLLSESELVAVDESFTNLEFSNSCSSVGGKIYLDGVSGQARFSEGIISGNLTVTGQILNAGMEDRVQGIEMGTVTSVPNETPSAASLYPVGEGMYKLDLTLQAGPQGIQGERGEQGIQGPTGPEGPVGMQGPPGVDGEAIFQIGNVVSRGSNQSADAEIRVVNGINYLDLWLVQGVEGQRGPKGDDGARGSKGDQGDRGEQGK